MMDIKTPAERQLYRIIELGLALDPIVEMVNASIRYIDPKISSEHLKALQELLEKMRDCIPKGVCNLQSREDSSAFSYLFMGEVLPSDIFKELTNKSSKVSVESILSHRDLKSLDELTNKLKKTLLEIQNQGAMELFDYLGPFIFPSQLENFNIIFNEDLITYKSGVQNLLAQFQVRLDEKNTEAPNPDQENAKEASSSKKLTFYQNIKRKQQRESKKLTTNQQAVLEVWEMQQKLSEYVSAATPPRVTFELLKSYITTMEVEHELNRLPPGLDKDFKLVEMSLDFMRQHMTEKEFKTTLDDINHAVSDNLIRQGQKSTTEYHIDQKYPEAARPKHR